MVDTKTPLARKHHYVPQFYLQGFANANGQLFTVDAKERRPFYPTPEGIAAQRDFNRIDAKGIPPDALEKELGKFEGVIAPGDLPLNFHPAAVRASTNVTPFGAVSVPA